MLPGSGLSGHGFFSVQVRFSGLLVVLGLTVL